MKPSRELDALVAKTLAWVCWDNWEYADYEGREGVTFFAVMDEQWLTVYDNGAESPTRYVAFSERIEDAWPLLEQGDWHDARILMMKGKRVACELEYESGFCHIAEAETAPHAITLAWLQAKGVEIPE